MVGKKGLFELKKCTVSGLKRQFDKWHLFSAPTPPPPRKKCLLARNGGRGGGAYIISPWITCKIDLPFLFIIFSSLLFSLS